MSREVKTSKRRIVESIVESIGQMARDTSSVRAHDRATFPDFSRQNGTNIRLVLPVQRNHAVIILT